MYTGKIFTVIAGNYPIDKLFILILLRGSASPQAFAYWCPVSGKNQKIWNKKAGTIYTVDWTKRSFFDHILINDLTSCANCVLRNLTGRQYHGYPGW